MKLKLYNDEILQRSEEGVFFLSQNEDSTPLLIDEKQGFELIDRTIGEKVMKWLWAYSPSAGQKGWFENVDGVYEGKTVKFSPTTDLNDAWLVAEKLCICIYPQAGEPPYEMKCLAERESIIKGKFEAFAETPQLAICKVALMFASLMEKEVRKCTK